MLGPLFFLSLLFTDVTSNRFSISKDLLPFGVPSEFAEDTSPVFSPEELVTCFNTYVRVERLRLKLDLDRATLAVEESHGIINMQRRQSNAPKDDLDRQLDEIEKLAAEESSLKNKTSAFLISRTGFLKEYAAFIEDCGFKTYRASDVRMLFPDGVPK